MKVVIQRVKKAIVSIEGGLYSEISSGLLVLLGITHDDVEEDALWLVSKIANLRIFNDKNKVMNLSALDTGKQVMVVSQFTLMASTKKGNRPSYVNAAKENISLPLYHFFVTQLRKTLPQKVETGRFGAEMLIELQNDGPVTIIINSKDKE